MSQPATSFEVVRIEPVNRDVLPDTHSRHVEECRVSWRSEHVFDSPQEASAQIDGYVRRDKRESVGPGFYVIVAEGGNPLRDPGCMALVSHPRSTLALPF